MTEYVTDRRHISNDPITGPHNFEEINMDALNGKIYPVKLASVARAIAKTIFFGSAAVVLGSCAGEGTQPDPNSSNPNENPPSGETLPQPEVNTLPSTPTLQEATPTIADVGQVSEKESIKPTTIDEVIAFINELTSQGKDIPWAVEATEEEIIEFGGDPVTLKNAIEDEVASNGDQDKVNMKLVKDPGGEGWSYWITAKNDPKNTPFWSEIDGFTTPHNNNYPTLQDGISPDLNSWELIKISPELKEGEVFSKKPIFFNGLTFAIVQNGNGEITAVYDQAPGDLNRLQVASAESYTEAAQNGKADSLDPVITDTTTSIVEVRDYTNLSQQDLAMLVSVSQRLLKNGEDVPLSKYEINDSWDGIGFEIQVYGVVIERPYLERININDYVTGEEEIVESYILPLILQYPNGEYYVAKVVLGPESFTSAYTNCLAHTCPTLSGDFRVNTAEKLTDKFIPNTQVSIVLPGFTAVELQQKIDYTDDYINNPDKSDDSKEVVLDRTPLLIKFGTSTYDFVTEIKSETQSFDALNVKTPYIGPTIIIGFNSN